MFFPLSHWGIMTRIQNLIGIFEGATPIGNYSIGIIGAKFVNYYNWLDYWDILFSYWSIPTIVLTNHQKSMDLAQKYTRMWGFVYYY